VKQAWCLITLSLLVVACRHVSPTPQSNDTTRIASTNDVYNFPIKPGSPAWADLQSHDEMIAVCQLPGEILKEISTPGLVQTVLNYPLLSDMYAFSAVQQGFDSVTANFNGLQELLKRDNAAKEIAKFYYVLSPEAATTQSIEEQGDYIFRIAHTEVILAQYTVLEQLSAVELKELANVAWQFWEAKKALPEIYGGLGRESTIFLLARVMQKAGYAPFLQFLATDKDADYLVRELAPAQNEQDVATLQKIVEYAEQFVHR